MNPGTRVEVLASRPEGVKGLRGEVLGTESGRVLVTLPGFDGHLSFAESQLRRVDDRPRGLRDAEQRAAASSFFVFDEVKKPPRRRKRHRLAARAEQLTEEQLVVLVRLLEGEMLLCTVGGKSYAVDRVPVGWWVRGLGPDDEEHTVSEDLSACSCQDFRFRNRRCKHLEAVTRATTV